MNQYDILLCTLNSTYQHSSFGLRYLYANLGELQARAFILESTIKENPRNLVEKILAYRPRIVGFSVYIWNTLETLETIMILKKISPEIIIVLGGPEISYETETQEHLKWADYVIKGEADFSFREFCLDILVRDQKPAAQIISSDLPDIKKIIMPYDLYSNDDIQNRVIYVEASRGCPYKCEYCLSSLDKSVRSFDLDLFMAQMKTLMDRGVRTFKFVDRTFNLSPTTSTRILQFFLDHIDLGLFLHFELVPDRLPAEIRELICKFPSGSLQFEVGIQTLNPIVAQNVSRKNDLTKVRENFKFIREHTQVHTHADLIVGLPGETFESFGRGFDELAFYGPDEIQVGILKRLKGTPISRHEKTFKMVYSEAPPFQIISTDTMDYVTLQKMNRFAKFWDLYANSGEFKNFVEWLRTGKVAGTFSETDSFFNKFFSFTEYLSGNFSDTHSLSLMTLAEKAWSFMILQGASEDEAAELIEKDYCYGAKRRDTPPFLKKYRMSSGTGSASTSTTASIDAKNKNSLNSRQLKHLN
ncbi:B12-binding domain-containing radical SAM protein [bacterium]|nr:B12-binding domain-containing radical SAM protein [bacterium]